MPSPAAAQPARRRTSRALLIAATAAAALIVLLVVSLVRAANDGPTVTAQGGEPAAGQVSGGEGARVGGLAPSMTAQALDGAEVRLPTGKPVAVFFFAAWCGTCLPEASALAQLQRDQGQQISIVAVDVDPGDTPDMIRQFLEAAGNPTYPVVHDKDGSLARAYNVTALDITVITDAKGKVVYRDAVPSTMAQLRDAFRLAGAPV